MGCLTLHVADTLFSGFYGLLSFMNKINFLLYDFNRTKYAAVNENLSVYIGSAIII